MLSHMQRLDSTVTIAHRMMLFSVHCDSPLTTARSIYCYFSVFTIVDIYLAVGKQINNSHSQGYKGVLCISLDTCIVDPTEPVGDISENTKVKISCDRSHIVYIGHVSHV